MSAANDNRCGRRSPDEELRRPLILILGIGNTLLTDEGIGIHVVETLRDSFRFSENVKLVDGGTLGLGLLEEVMDADSLIVIDAVRGGSMPGTLYRLTGADLNGTLTGANSLHEIGLVETLAAARLLGKLPETIILGIEPKDIVNWSTNLTETIKRKVPELVVATLHEIERIGGEYVKAVSANS